MIVFKSDWKKYPKAIVDTKTRNKSFLRIAALLREMGVDHYYFPLALLQPELQGVDPYDVDNLTFEQKVMILYECDHNPWYFLREIAMVPGASNEDRDEYRYVANRGNIAAMWLLLASIDYIQVQIRQTGKSFGTDNNSLWLMYFKYMYTSMHIITKDETLRKENIARLKKLRNEWPDYLNRNTSKDDNNQISLSCHDRENKLYTHVGQTSEKAANNLGRGMTTPYMDVDEGPFINYIETTVSAAMGAMIAARELAAKKGYPHCVIFTTTAGKQDDRDGKYMYTLMRNAAVWTEKFYDVENRDQLIQLILANSSSRTPMVNLTLSHRQVGKSDEWLYEKVAAARSEGENIDRDYFNIWTSGSQKSILSVEVSKAIRESQMDGIDVWISRENYIFNWYEAIDPTKQYVLCVDTSDAIGRDDIAITVINSETGAVAGAATVNDTNLMRFAAWLAELMLKYRNTVLIIERHYNAQVIIDYLLIKLPENGEDPFKRMYNKVVQEKNDRQDDYASILVGGAYRPAHVYDRFRKDFGFKTSGSGTQSRQLLYGSVFMNAAKDTCHLVRDNKLIQQVLSLVVKNGRIDHENGEHDDTVISWLLGHWFLNFGINLSHYGINPSRVMIERAHNGKKLTDEEKYEIEEQKHLLSRVKEIHEKLKDATDSMAIMRLESELTALMPRLKSADTEGMTLDALLEEAAEARRNRTHRGTAGPGVGRDRMIHNLMKLR